ncbi:MAG TPA: hypothetical protein VIG66_07385 [Noviherbaspirillum sp.]
MAKSCKTIISVLFSVSLVACGGGGGGADGSAALSATPDPQTASEVDSSANGTGHHAPVPTGSTPPARIPDSATTTLSFVYDETARFNGPAHIVSDAAGNLYVNDFFNQRIRKVSASGAVSTHPAAPAWRQDLEIDAAGNLYALEGDVIRKFAPQGNASELATLPEGQKWMTMDATGNLYVLVTNGTQGTATIFKVTPVGEVTTAFSGEPLRAASSRAIAVDADGHLYVGSFGGDIVKIPAAGPAFQYALVGGEVEDLMTDAAGNLYAAWGVYSRPSPGYCMGQPTCEIRVIGAAIDKIAPDGSITPLMRLSEQGDGIMTANQMGVPRLTMGSAGYPGQSYVYAAFGKGHAIYKVTPSNYLRLIAGAPGQSGSSD